MTFYNDALQCPMMHYKNWHIFVMCVAHDNSVHGKMYQYGSAMLCFNHDGIL